jgi:hypothetical protein
MFLLHWFCVPAAYCWLLYVNLTLIYIYNKYCTVHLPYFFMFWLALEKTHLLFYRF